jgi:phage-related protein
VFGLRGDGASVEFFTAELTPIELAKFLHTVELLEQFGNQLGLPHSRHMGDGLLELRVRGKREIRILYCFHMKSAVLLHIFIKKTEKTQIREITKALSRMQSM